VNSLCPKMDELCSYDVACVSLSNGERLVPQGFFMLPFCNLLIFFTRCNKAPFGQKSTVFF
jgi:hypothetical protein